MPLSTAARSQVTRADLFPEFSEFASLGAITVSARLDGDGVAATRGADDLVGSAFATGGQSDATLELKPRGAVSSFMKK